MAATRFMRDLDIELVPNENVASVDLFDMKHARKVLAAYGRAVRDAAGRGARADQGTEKVPRQSHFRVGPGRAGRARATRTFCRDGQEQALDERDPGRGRRHAGRRRKVLEDSFGSPRSNPAHRYHAIAAKAVLESLLPDTNADIKGRKRSIAELRDVSGYASRPIEFAELMQVLDRNLRLITPVDVENSIDENAPLVSKSDQYYQLTHDYLVHSVRDWLNKGRLATRRGRAELLLADRAGLWSVHPENRHLPSPREWATIGLLANRKKWTEPQQRQDDRRRSGAWNAVDCSVRDACGWSGLPCGSTTHIGSRRAISIRSRMQTWRRSQTSCGNSRASSLDLCDPASRPGKAAGQR